MAASITKPHLKQNHLYQVMWTIERFLEISDPGSHDDLSVDFKLNENVDVQVEISIGDREVTFICDEHISCYVSILNASLERRGDRGNYFFTLSPNSSWSDYCDDSDLILKMQFRHSTALKGVDYSDETTIMHITTNGLHPTWILPSYR